LSVLFFIWMAGWNVRNLDKSMMGWQL